MGMLVLVSGLVLFLGMHSTRIVAEGWRTAMLQRLGERSWKGLFSAVSILGFILILWGYAQARQQPVVLWGQPPMVLRYLVALLTLLAFVLVAAAYVPRNELRSRLRHPMILGVKVWAFAHLIANNTLADTVLFGSFLVWAALDFRSARRRDRTLLTRPAGTVPGTTLTIAVGAAAWLVFALWLHPWWIGMAVLPG